MRASPAESRLDRSGFGWVKGHATQLERKPTTRRFSASGMVGTAYLAETALLLAIASLGGEAVGHRR
jgi:hypothetical protein